MQSIENEWVKIYIWSRGSLYCMRGLEAPKSRRHNILFGIAYLPSFIYACEGTCGVTESRYPDKAALIVRYAYQGPGSVRLYILLSILLVMNTSPTRNWPVRQRQLPLIGYLPRVILPPLLCLRLSLNNGSEWNISKLFEVASVGYLTIDVWSCGVFAV